MDDLGSEISVSLAEVVHKDRELFQEVCQSYVDLYRVAVKLLDNQGSRLMDIPSRAELCQYIYGFQTCRLGCVRTVNAIRSHEPAFQTVEQSVCFSGAEYRIVPIHYATDVVGKVVFGPFLPTTVTGPPAHFLAMDPGLDARAAWEKTVRFRKMSPTLAEKVARNLATVIEVMSFVGFKGQMTTDMHVESITEAYAELEAKNKALEASVHTLQGLNEERSTFLARISDQVKKPLTNLIGYAEMLAEGIGGDVTEDQTEFLGTMIAQGELILGLAETMDELSLIERGQINIAPHSASIEELLMSVLDFGQKQGELHDVEVEILPADPDLPKLWVDEDRIRSILLRIIDNAVKFTPAGGRVVISAFGEDDITDGDPVPPGFVALAVTDSGIGVSPAYHDQLFHPFYSVHGAESAYTGTGVGLTIAAAYAEAHGGKILVQSKPNAGSTFSILLPTSPSSSLP